MIINYWPIFNWQLSSSGALLPFSLENHHPEPIPPTASQFAPKKRCRVCYAKKVRKEVRFCCSACPDRPGLCLDPCFYEYHELFVIPKFFPQGIVCADWAVFFPPPNCLRGVSSDQLLITYCKEAFDPRAAHLVCTHGGKGVNPNACACMYGDFPYMHVHLGNGEWVKTL